MKILKTVLESCDTEFTPDKEKKFISYMEGILEKNQYVNLTAIKNRDEFIQKHYVDSIMCAGYNEFKKAETVIDLGTGGGFPGIPLAIAFPQKKFILADSLNKRIKIICELCSELGIDNVEAVHGRAEELGRRKELRESFDLCVSRAVANMSTLSEYCLPFVKVGGAFIAYKGPDCEGEIREAQKAIELLGGKVTHSESPSIEGFPFDHRLVFIFKEKSTGSKFPRKSGTPSKEPIK